MNYKVTAKSILEYVGGKDNVAGFTHCATRLRFTTKDNSKVETNKLKEVVGVIGVMKSGAQYQVIIGTEVAHVAKELVLLGIKTSSEDQESSTSMSQVDRFFDTISGIFTPLIPALIAAGMLKAVLVILDVVNVLPQDSSSYQILGFVSDATFYFLPVFVAVTTAQKLRCNPYVAGMLGAALIHPTFTAMIGLGEPISLFGLNVPLVSYSASVIPAILTVWFMSYVEQFADRVSPKFIKFILKPLLTVVIVIPFTLLIFGPLGSYVGGLLASGSNYLYATVPWLVAPIMGAIVPFLVLTGMHWSFVPVVIQAYEAFGQEGIIGVPMFVSNICQGAVSLAVGLKTKNLELRQTALSAGVTALFGITEPALFGVTLKVRKAMIAVMAGGAVGGLYAGLLGVVSYTLGTPGLASFALFMGSNPMNVVHALIAVGIGFVVTFISAWIMTNPDSIEVNGEKPTFKAFDKKSIKAPLVGDVVLMKDVKDPTFANNIIGKGIAIYPRYGEVYAPFDGKIAMAFSTGHAIGLVDNDGMELLIHIGIDTVKLDGDGFKLLVKQGDTVRWGQKLVEFDLDVIEKKGYDLTTPIIVTNLSEEVELIATNNHNVSLEDNLMVLI